MRLELGRADHKNESLTVTFFKVLVAGWLLYFFVFLFVEHFVPGVTLDFMFHDNYENGTNDWFRDFVEVNCSAARGDSYLTGSCANYPPLVLAIAKFFALFTPNALSELTYFEIGRTLPARITYFVFVALVIGVFAAMVYRYIKKNHREIACDKTLPLLIALSLTLSYPMIFAFERGNYAMLALLGFALFVFNYEKAPILSAVALAICACIKVYPVLFFVVFLIDKKYKPFLIGMVTGIAGLFVPMLVLEGNLIQQFTGFLGGVLNFNSGSQALKGEPMPFYQIEQHSNSFSNIFRLFGVCLTLGGRLADQMRVPVLIFEIISKIATVLLLAVSAVAFVINKDTLRRVLIILSLLLLLPNNTFDYMLILFLPILAVLLCRGEKKDRKYVVLLTLLACTPKVYFFPHYPLDVSIQTVLNPILMTVMLLFFLCDGLRNFRNKPGKGAEK